MSNSNCFNNNTVTKKCGEIILTMKKNTKHVYSFNCWFCDTIYIQMKKFTLHLEKEHVTQLEYTTLNNEYSKNNCFDKSEIEKEIATDSIFATEIKVEDCTIGGIKSETGENQQAILGNNKEKEHSFKFQDPLDTFRNNSDENTNAAPNEIDELVLLKVVNMQFDNNSKTGQVEMQNSSHDDHGAYNSDFSGEVNASDSDFEFEKSVDEKLSKHFNLNSKSQDKHLILALIDAYKRNPKLWNASLSRRCNVKEKENLLQSITDDLNTKLKLKLKLYMVKKKLNYICKQYEQEIEKQMNENETDIREGNSELWFFKNMSFLKSIIENKIKLRRKKPNKKVKPLNDKILCDLIDIYKNYNSLWDVNHLAYTVKDKRHETMQSMLQDIEVKMNIILDVYKLEKHLHYIHKSFARDKKVKLECDIKQLEFRPSCSYFYKCEFLETHQGPFRCHYCNEIIDAYNDFQIHKSQHDGSIPFKCQECGMGFKKITNYTIHAKRHLRIFKFHCDICGKGYPFNAELDLHMRSHTGVQPYLCSICGEGFRTAISYDNHIRRHEERYKYFCHICKKGFNHMTRLNDHVKAHLNVRDVICAVCGKGFTSRKYLNHHKRIHEGKNYSCNICGKSFAQDAGLRAHKKYHGTPIGISSIHKEQNKYKIL